MDEPNFEEEIDMIVNSFDRDILDEEEHDIEIAHYLRQEDESSSGSSTSKRYKLEYILMFEFITVITSSLLSYYCHYFKNS
jgi:hypothetical protein